MNNYKIIKSSDKDYPPKLLKIKDYPKEIYVIGNKELLYKDSIAIVGSRDCTLYGEKYAYNFSKKLSEEGLSIISGMAIGIDTAAHFGALKEKGKTIAVLGSGFDKIYPEENIYLFNKILENNGCVISEYPPDKEAILSNFPKRNRIISGLSNGVLVIEAKHRSGSLVTAKYAIEQNKKVFCIPSNLGEKTGVGTNRLLQNGANLVTSYVDILNKINILDNNKEEKKIEIEIEFEEIFNLMKDKPTNINNIAKQSNLAISEVTQKLLLMELKGYIKSLPGNEYVRL